MRTRLAALRTRFVDRQKGGIGYVLLWLLGVPVGLIVVLKVFGVI